MCVRFLAPLALLLAVSTLSFAQETATKPAPTAQHLAARGVEYLRAAQADDGSFSSHAGPGITAIATAGLLRSGLTTSDPAVSKGLEYLLGFTQDDGGVYGEGSRYKNYETSLAILCLTEANKDGKYDDVIEKAQAFLKGIQWDEEEDHGPDSYYYGGGGYGSHSRPDLSNTSFLIDALVAAGNGPDDPAIQKALVFVSRTQNLESKYNATPFAAKVGDGGFYYTPAAGGTSQAGKTENGGLRSYGSMTYAGLKSMIYAGVDKDDPRVKAAYNWIKQHFTLEENPGMGAAGQFYYYHTFAKALHAMEVDEVTDSDGKSHDWQQELVATLADLQQDDGSWLNTGSERWLEADPNLVTGYALLALSYCK
ncbi:prenyltransferase/squalene oxidase repeat-containing protein [Aeoliella sp.]|uniref:prenyltransferase/squalene oxidase repeat-containing protein n=1 Tax=Aeoliella sp. TaxID=2795800 RepID=UPI003CCBD9EE